MAIQAFPQMSAKENSPNIPQTFPLDILLGKIPHTFIPSDIFSRTYSAHFPSLDNGHSPFPEKDQLSVTSNGMLAVFLSSRTKHTPFADVKSWAHVNALLYDCTCKLAAQT